MASLRRLEANRRNALMSTGPQTEAGKKRSRGNAVRHGLTAETVIVGLEDAEDYKAFELSVTADFDARTAVERELVLRLASLLWRLRRAAAIETGLLQIQSEILREARHAQANQPQHHVQVLDAVRLGGGVRADCGWDRQGDVGHSQGPPQTINVEVGRCFLRLIYVIRNGLRWRDAPREYGPHKTIYNRFVRWSRLGVFNKIFAELARNAGKPQRRMIDAIHLKAHRIAASLFKKELFPTVSGARRAA